MARFEEQVFSALPRYEYASAQLRFHFVLQPYSSSISMLRFVSEDGQRAMPVPPGVTMHTRDGVTPDCDGMFPFIWIEAYELRRGGHVLVRLQPQQQRVQDSHSVRLVNGTGQ